MNHGLKKIASCIMLLASCFFIFISPVHAVCPVCTLAIGGGVLLSRYLGVDDLIIGVWVGGLLLSLGLWMASYIKKKFIPFQDWLLVILFWVITYLSFKKAGYIGHPYNKFCGYDKMLLGMGSGTISFLLGYFTDKLLRKFNKKDPGKALFPYQKVVFPVAFLIITTLIALRLCYLVK